MSYVAFDVGEVAIPVPQRGDPDLAPLLSSKLESGYQGVYRVHDGRWRAKAFKRHIGYARTPREAAKMVADFWKEVFGERWEAFFRGRFCCGWFVVRVRQPEGLLAARRIGDDLRPGSWAVEPATAECHRLRIYEQGRIKYLPPPPCRADVFATEADAAWYFRKWAAKRYADGDARLALRQAVTPS